MFKFKVLLHSFCYIETIRSYIYITCFSLNFSFKTCTNFHYKILFVFCFSLFKKSYRKVHFWVNLIINFFACGTQRFCSTDQANQKTFIMYIYNYIIAESLYIYYTHSWFNAVGEEKRKVCEDARFCSSVVG